MAGFYSFFTVGDVTNAQLDLPPTVTARAVVLRSYGDWFANLLWGDPGGKPWLAIALVSGAVSGLLGYWWRVRQMPAAAIVVAAALIVEPLVYLGRLNVLITGSAYRLDTANLMIWGTELLLKVLNAVGVTWRWRTRSRRR